MEENPRVRLTSLAQIDQKLGSDRHNRENKHTLHSNQKRRSRLVRKLHLREKSEKNSENTEFLTKVRKAWRVDLETEQFNEINVRGLEF